MADSVAITAQLNGAEYLELLAGAGEASVSLPAYVLTRCGVEAWRLEAARDHTAPPPRGRQVRLALERRSVTLRAPRRVYAELDAGATAAGISIPQYIRTRCDFEVRWTSLPNTDGARPRGGGRLGSPPAAWSERAGLLPAGIVIGHRGVVFRRPRHPSDVSPPTVSLRSRCPFRLPAGSRRGSHIDHARIGHVLGRSVRQAHRPVGPGYP